MPSSTDPPVHAQPIGPVGGAFAFVIATCLILMGPVMAYIEGTWAAGLCSGIFTMPIGILLAIQTVEWRRQAKRLAAVGVDAIAEVLTATIREGGENDDMAELTIRLTGSSFETFDAPCELAIRGRSYKVGDRLDAVVDTSDNTFAIYD